MKYPTVPFLAALACSGCISAETATKPDDAYSLSRDAYAGVVIGMPVSEAIKVLDGYESDAELYDFGDCYYLVPGEGRSGPSFMIWDGTVARIDVYAEESTVTTSEGIGIGDRKEDVVSTYVDVGVSPHPYVAPAGEYLEVRLDNGNGIIFETYEDAITSFRLGRYPEVELIEGCL